MEEEVIEQTPAPTTEQTFTGKVSESISFSASQKSDGGYIWDVDILREGRTLTANVDLTPYGLSGKRGRFEYPAEVLAKAVESQLFENAPLILRPESDHSDYANGRSKNLKVNEETELNGGVFRETFMGRNAEGKECVKGKLILRRNKSGKAMREFLRGKASESGRVYGLSWTGDTKYILKDVTAKEPTLQVTEIVQVLSVDPVERGNAGGEIIRAAESFFKKQPMDKQYLQMKSRAIAMAAEADIDGAGDASASGSLPATVLDYVAEQVWEKMAGAKDAWDSIDDVKALPEEKLVRLFDKTCKVTPATTEVVESIQPQLMNAAENQSAKAAEAALADVNTKLEALNAKSAKIHLDNELRLSNLPQPAQEQIRKQFEGGMINGRAAETSEIDGAIRGAKDLAAALTPQATYSSPRVTLDETDKMSRGWDALFFTQNEGKAAEAFEKANGWNPLDRKYRVFNGLKEAWLNTVGLRDLGASMWTDTSGRAAETISSTANTNIVGDALHRKLHAVYKSLVQYDSWKKVASVMDATDFKANNAYRFGDITSFATVTGTNEYQEASITNSESTSVTVARYGGILSLGYEQIRNDDMNALRGVVTSMARTMKRQIYESVFNLLYNGFSTNYSDSVAYFHADHDNTPASSPSLGAASVIVGRNAMMQQAQLGSSKPMGIAPKYLVYSTGLYTTAYDILTPAAGESNIVATADQSLRLEGIEVPHFSFNRWFLVADPEDAPAINVAFLDGVEEPELVQEPLLSNTNFLTESIRWRCKSTYGMDYADFRPAYGSLNS